MVGRLKIKKWINSKRLKFHKKIESFFRLTFSISFDVMLVKLCVSSIGILYLYFVLLSLTYLNKYFKKRKFELKIRNQKIYY
jgi:hypothetical protein